MEIFTFPVTPFMTNCYVIKDEGEAIVVDPGEATPALFSAIDGCVVRSVVNTHCHCDHCGGNAAVMAHTGAELLCHVADLPLLREIQQQGFMFGLQISPSPEPNVLLEEGDTVRVGGLAFEVLHTPGHSPGHIVLATDGLVIAGDVLFSGSIGRSDLPGGDHAQLLESIRTKLLPLPDETVVCCGHGPRTTIGEERESNPFLVGLEVEGK